MVADGLLPGDGQGLPLAILVAPGAQVIAPEDDLLFFLSLVPGAVVAVSWLDEVALLADEGSGALDGSAVRDGSAVVDGAEVAGAGADVGGLPGEAGLGGWAAATPTSRRPAPRAPARR